MQAAIEDDVETWEHGVFETIPTYTFQPEDFDIADLTAITPSLSEALKKDILTSVLLPAESFVFPITEKKKKKFRFQRQWAERYSWLAYSVSEDGVFCKICCLFRPEKVGHEGSGALVASAFRQWKNALEKFEKHQNRHYHAQSELQANLFLESVSGDEEHWVIEVNPQDVLDLMSPKKN